MNRTIDRSVPKLGVRSTRQRTAVVGVLKDLDYFASAKVIHQELTKRDLKVGLTTVYRTLQSLSEIEAVDVLHMSNGETLYRHCLSDEHHHHLVCTECGPVAKLAKEVAQLHGVREKGHDAEIYGLCESCSAATE